MASLDKVEALIKIAEAMENGDNSKYALMNKIFSKAIRRERNECVYKEKIEVTTEEKKIFNLANY